MSGFDLQTEWDPVKALRNIAKHGVSFESARTVLLHPLSITYPDVEHSTPSEARWITIGYAESGTMLVIAQTWDDLTPTSARVRIISARKATRNEMRTFEKEQQ